MPGQFLLHYYTDPLVRVISIITMAIIFTMAMIATKVMIVTSDDDYDDKDDDLISVENHPHLILSITIVIIFITTLCCSTISTSRSLFF